MARSFRALATGVPAGALAGISIGRPVGSRWFVALALAALWAVAGCAQSEAPPPPVESDSWSASSGTPSDMQSITVSHGDSLYLIAKRYAVPMRELIDLNHLKPPYQLEPGRRLMLPNTHTYTVVPGDRLSVLAQRFHVETAELARINQLAPPYVIRVGQLLVLPGGPLGPQAAPPGGGPGMGEPSPSTHGSTSAIRTAALPPPSALPPSSSPSPSPSPSPLPPPPQSSSPQASSLPPPPPPPRRPPSGAAPSPVAIPSPTSAPPVPSAAAPAVHHRDSAAGAAVASARGGAHYLWPVQGKIISGFGDKPDGRHNDGINIEAGRGTAVVAADSGVVAYSGNELRGYGNLLLIRHSDGYMTAYAHLDRALVERGATVQRGEKIGIVGATGSVTEPQLHFEVRRGSQAVDPADFLGPSHSG